MSLAACLAACGGSNNNSTTDGGKGSGSGSGSDSEPGVYAIPLTTPDESFWGPQLMAGGASFTMDLDTGSTTTGIAGSACTNCGVSPVYVPSGSAVDEHETASTMYDDGTGWSGEIYNDTITLGDGTPSATLAIVDITAQSFATNDSSDGFFYENQYQGILGMGPPLNAEPDTGAYFDTITTTGGVTPIVAFELCADGGTMWLGGYDASHGGSGQFTPLDAITEDNAFYSVDLTGASLGSAALSDNTSGDFSAWVVDTGTSLFYVPTALDQAFLAQLNQDLQNEPTLFGSGAQFTDEGCLSTTATDAQIEAMLPPFVMTMKGMNGAPDIKVSAGPFESYLYDQGGGSICLGLDDAQASGPGAATMGDQIMQSFITVVDEKNQRIGWVPDTYCSTHPGARVHDRERFHPHPPKPHHPKRHYH